MSATTTFAPSRANRSAVAPPMPPPPPVTMATFSSSLFILESPLCEIMLSRMIRRPPSRQTFILSLRITPFFLDQSNLFYHRYDVRHSLSSFILPFFFSLFKTDSLLHFFIPTKIKV